MIWAVKGRERYFPTFRAHDLDAPPNPIGDPHERSAVVITYGDDREHAKRNAQPELGGNPDRYIVEPLASDSDRVIFKLELRGEIAS